MRLADKLELPVPAVQIRYVPESVYLIERFDREGGVTELTRLHTIDACQLLNLDRSYKYSQATVATLMAIVGSIRLRAVARERLFRWIVFNLGNNDAHLKKLSFYHRHDGVKLAPFYDMVCTAVYQPELDWLNDQLSWPVGTAKCLGEVSREQVLALGAELGVPFRLGKAVIDSLVDQADRRAAEVIAEFEAIQDAHGWRQGEVRLLRQIRHGVIQDMRRLLK